MSLFKEDLQGVILRLGTIFGTSPGMRFHTAIKKILLQAIMGIPITVWKTVYWQKRPNLDLTDAIRCIVFLLKKDLFNGCVYNVVTLNATIREVVNLIQAFVPTQEVEFVDSRIMNQLSYEALTIPFLLIFFKTEIDNGLPQKTQSGSELSLFHFMDILERY